MFFSQHQGSAEVVFLDGGNGFLARFDLLYFLSRVLKGRNWRVASSILAQKAGYVVHGDAFTFAKLGNCPT